MALCLYYDINTRSNEDVSDEILNNPKWLLMLRVADVVITHARIDSLMFNLIMYFKKYIELEIILEFINKIVSEKRKLQSTDDLKDEFVKRMSFEEKRTVLFNLFKEYKINYSSGFLSNLKEQNIDLLKFIKDLQELENPRNDLAHKDTLIEIHNIISEFETRLRHPELLNDNRFRELTGIDRIGELIDINEIYHRYNKILAPYNFLIDMLNLDMDEKLVREILKLPTKEYLDSDGRRIYL